MKDVSPRTRRWIIVGVAFALALLFIACQAGSPAHAAEPQPAAFTSQGVSVQPDRLIGDVGTKKQGPCWGWTQDFPVQMSTIPHKQMYDPGVRVQWCANPNRTKVTKLLLFQCYDGGGYYDYDGCTKSKGKLGYASLGLSCDWTYHWATGIPGVTDTRTPSIVFSVYPDGHVAGTIYFDN